MREYILRRKGEEDKERVLWDRARWQMFLTMQMHPHIKPHNKPKTPEAWVRFPWERTGELTQGKAVMTDEEIDKLNALKTAFFNKKNITKWGS